MDNNSPEKQDSLQSLEKSWWKELAKQSWEPELLISGICIYAIAQMPDGIYQMRQVLQYNLPTEMLLAERISMAYMYFCYFILLINFVGHFILRAYWVGLIGLISVFPKGIQFDKINGLTEPAKERARKRLPDIKSFAENIDKIASSIFAFSFAAVFMYISFSFVLFIVFGIFVLVPEHLRPFSLEKLVNLLMYIILALSIFAGIVSSTDKIKNPLVLKIGDIVGEALAVSFTTFLRKPIEYVSFVFSSNYSLKRGYYFIGIYLSSLIVLSMGFIFFLNTNKAPGHWRQAFSKADGSQYSNSKHYSDKQKEGMVLLPQIQSEVVKDGYLDLFIPYLKSMDNSLKNKCDFPGDEEKESYPIDLAKASHLCLENYLQIWIDGKAIDSKEFVFTNHTNRNEKGLKYFISTKELQEGKHLLKIGADHFEENAKKEKAVEIPFWIFD